MSTKGSKKKLSFPTAYTVLFIVLILAAVLTHTVPAGSYAKLIYDDSANIFTVTAPDGTSTEYEATQETLDTLGVKVNIERFTDGSIYKAVAIPETYEELDSKPQGFKEVVQALIKGVYDTIDIIMFVFMIAGYNVIVCIAALYMGSSIGTMFSTVNPFSSVIASNAAGITFTNGLMFRAVGLVIATTITVAYIIRYAERIKKDPTKSLIYDQKEELEKHFLHGNKEVPEFTFRRKLMLILFTATFGVMIWGVATQGWWFMEMTTLFFVVGVILCALSGMGEKVAVHNFVAGAADLVGVALTIGVARAVNLIMDNGLISDTILHGATGIVDGMNGGIFSIIMLLIFTVLGFFIPSSSSGLAVLSMPIMAPLADTVGLPRDIIVSAYQYGQGLMAFITPTGLILVTLSMVGVTYDRWLKFILPLMGIIGGFSALMLLAQALI